jgi:hypothetical protein
MSYLQRDLSPLVRGDDWVIKLNITSGGIALDVTGFSYWMTLKDDYDDLDPGAIQVTTTALAGADSTAGIVYITAARANTTDIEAGNYYYDIQQLDADDVMQTILIGKVQVVKDITRAVV